MKRLNKTLQDLLTVGIDTGLVSAVHRACVRSVFSSIDEKVPDSIKYAYCAPQPGGGNTTPALAFTTTIIAIQDTRNIQCLVFEEKKKKKL